jgi:hypothetical protein
LKPKYDSQEEIYTQLLLNLDKANALIDTSKKFKDLLFAGDMMKWKKLCNSLHIRLLMRISNKVNVSKINRDHYKTGSILYSNQCRQCKLCVLWSYLTFHQ